MNSIVPIAPTHALNSIPDDLPTRAGPQDVRYDFNDGCRVWVPPGNWRVQLRDLDTGNILFDAPVSGGLVQSKKRYHVRFGIIVWCDGFEVFSHVFDAVDQDVLVRMELGGLGDHIAWIGHAAAFAVAHGCRVTCCVRPDVIALLRDVHPSVSLVVVGQLQPARFYATYKVLIFYDDRENDWQPCDYRQVGLCNMAAYILGLPPVERRPDIAVDAGGPPIDEPYVCIATQASSQNKYWNNPHGWNDVITCLKAQGLRVICIDKEQVNGRGIVWNSIPHGAEDQTGDRPLSERARWLRHASCFIGPSSGLAWLAWAAGTPVVMISGFTHPMNEFHTPYRIINYHTCNSCSNDIRHRLDPTDFLWCPRQTGTDRIFECTRLITAEHVKAVIGTIPGFSHTERDGRPAAVKRDLPCVT